MASYELNLDNKDYPAEVLSYYLWGQAKPPSKEEMASENFDLKVLKSTCKTNFVAGEYTYM